MGLIEAIVLGIVQGLTEFLPVSSSGHVYLVSYLSKWDDPGSGFTAVIQLGTLVAVLIYFWSDLVEMSRAWAKGLRDKEARKEPKSKLAWAVLWGTIPIVVLGLAFQDQIDGELRNPWIVGSALIILGALMYAAEKVTKPRLTMSDTTVRDGIIVGLWQCLALIPGSSRSGSTITGALFLGFDRETAAKFSFLLSVPAIGGSGLYKLFSERQNLLEQGWMATIVATVVSLIVGYAAIAFLMNYLQKRSTLLFAIWRVVVGLIIFASALGWFGGAPSAG